MTKPGSNKRDTPEGKLLLDDLWLNETENILQRIAQRCEQDFGHKPSLEDFRQLIETKLCVGLEDYFADGESVEITKVIFKTRKKPPTQRYQVGDTFAIPLGDRQYAFGRIMRDPAFRPTGGALVEIFRETSQTKAYRSSIASSGRLFYPTDVNPLSCLKNRRWTVVASDPSYRFSDEDLDLEFLMPDPPRFWVAVRPFAPGSPSRPVTEEEWRRMDVNGQNPGLGRIVDFEARIREALSRQRRA